VVVEIINTGSELMLGRVLNTHQEWLCRQLSDMGRVVSRQVAVADTAADIQQAVRESLGRADLVITTGGLGPTSDDLTRDLIAQMLKRKLVEHAETLARLEQFFHIRKRSVPESTRVQAFVPEGATVLKNEHGTAPGLAIEISPNPFRPNGERSWLLMLPGPPRELRPMFTTVAEPLLRKVLPLEEPFSCLTLKTTGIGESVVQARIAPLLTGLVEAGLEVGYCARPGQVDVRLSAHGANGVKAVSGAEAIVRTELAGHIFGTDREELEQVLIHLLSERKQTLAVAESCTGGLLANRLTNVPGASVVLMAGLVTYSNEAKQKFLDVRAATLAEHGAVSAAVASEMAEGARRALQTDYALSTTGIAGPGGGSPSKPVGTVFIGLAGPSAAKVHKNFNPYDRETFKQITTDQALEYLRKTLMGL
jgi:nicotinamide-nucleotide amidase